MFEKFIVPTSSGLVSQYPLSKLKANLLSTEIDSIWSRKIRSSLHVYDSSVSESYDVIEALNSNEEIASFKKRVCYLDLNFFNDNQSILINPSESVLKISLKANAENRSFFNDLQFSFDCSQKNYLTCDMHLIYFFERIIFSIIQEHAPDIVIVSCSQTLTDKTMNMDCIFSGDSRKPFTIDDSLNDIFLKDIFPSITI